MELIVGSDESELAVPGRECDVPGRASCWANGMGLASLSLARSSNKRGVIMADTSAPTNCISTRGPEIGKKAANARAK